MNSIQSIVRLYLKCVSTNEWMQLAQLVKMPRKSVNNTQLKNKSRTFAKATKCGYIILIVARWKPVVSINYVCYEYFINACGSVLFTSKRWCAEGFCENVFPTQMALAMHLPHQDIQRVCMHRTADHALDSSNVVQSCIARRPYHL